MKKAIIRRIIAILAVFYALFSIVGCGSLDESLQFDKLYSYKGISFKKAAGLSFEDVASLVPTGAVVDGNNLVDTVTELEEYIATNIDSYSVVVHAETGNERIFIKPKVLSLRVTEGNPYVANGYSLWLTYAEQDGEFCYGAKKEGETFIFVDAYAPNDFYFSKAEFHQELMLNEKFSIIYNYRLNNR